MSEVSDHGGGDQWRPLVYKGNESAWQFVNQPWQTNDAGDMIVPGRRNVGMHLGFNTESAYGDCVISGKFQMSWIPYPQLIVRSLDSHRYYAVLFAIQHDDPRPASVDVDAPWLEPISVSIWKGADGYQRMMGYRRKAGYMPSNDRDRWYEAKVQCAGSNIIVFLDDRFICAVFDDEYEAGCVGVGSVWQGGVWRDLAVGGRPVETKTTWRMLEHGHKVTKPPHDLAPMDGSVHLPSLDESWKLSWQVKPGKQWIDGATNFDDMNMDNSWTDLSRSTDGGKTWSSPERLNVPFPDGQVYQPIKGKAGGIMIVAGKLAELNDGSIGLTMCWRNNPDGNYQADQVFFCRSTDGGKSWSRNAVDPTEWERNESTWVQFEDGELLCVMRSNYNTHLGVSRSTDLGKT